MCGDRRTKGTRCAVCCRPTEREKMERLIRKKLREIMMQKDLETVTCKEVTYCWSRGHRLSVCLSPPECSNLLLSPRQIRTELEMQTVCDLGEFKKFISNEMIVILGQMDSPTEVFEHVYLVGERCSWKLVHVCSFYWTEYEYHPQGSEWNASNLDELQASGSAAALWEHRRAFK